jgi:hypothetical protein
MPLTATVSVRDIYLELREIGAIFTPTQRLN